MKGAKKKAKPKWRKVVKEAMKVAAAKEAKLRYGQSVPKFNYRWEHVRAVVQMAGKLAELTDADVEIVEAAAWLHDIAKFQGEKHAEKGAKIAKKLLADSDFPPKKINRVVEAIADHNGLWLDKPLQSLESQLLWDADKLTKIGLTGVFHLTGMLAMEGKIAGTQDAINEFQSAKWMKKTVASMHTRPAKKAAEARLKRNNKLWEALTRELAGGDLK